MGTNASATDDVRSSAVTDLHTRLSALSANELDIGEHLQYLYELVLKTDAQTIVELGPSRGCSTSALLRGADETDGQVWSCDITVPDAGIFIEVAEHPRWTYVAANDLDVVDDAPRPIDLLFIDSEHTYEQTLAELNAYGPLVRSGGCIAMHDTISWGDFIRPAIAVYSTFHPFADEEWYDHCNGLFVGWV